MINNYKVGFAKEKATAEEIIEAIEQIKNNEVLEETYRENSKALLDEKFLWENNIEKLEKFLQS